MKCFKCNEEIIGIKKRGLSIHQLSAKCKAASALRNSTRKRKRSPQLEPVTKKAKGNEAEKENEKENEVSI